MSVCRVMRATSKRLCFIASMARSNSTLSGCLEPTLASGLLTFLLVQPMLSASAPSRTIVGKLRDIRTSETGRRRKPSILRADSRRARIRNSRYTNPFELNLQQSRFGCGLQQLLGICLWIALGEHGVACHQNFCAGADNLGHRIKGDAAVNLDPEM